MKNMSFYAAIMSQKDIQQCLSLFKNFTMFEKRYVYVPKGQDFAVCFACCRTCPLFPKILPTPLITVEEDAFYVIAYCVVFMLRELCQI